MALDTHVLVLIIAVAVLLALLFLMASFICYNSVKFKEMLHRLNKVEDSSVELGDIKTVKHNINREFQITISSGDFQRILPMTLENILHNLYNIRVKIDSRNEPFQSNKELPAVSRITKEEAKQDLKTRLAAAIRRTDQRYDSFMKVINSLFEPYDVQKMLEIITHALTMSEDIIRENKLEDSDIIGTLPLGMKGVFTLRAISKSKLSLEWKRHKIIQSAMLTEAMEQLLQLLRDENRQMSYSEYIALQITYYKMSLQTVSSQLRRDARFLGTSGFRKDSQTYMALTDPGDGHLMGTTKRNEWMKGATIHVEYLERPHNHPRSKIESYRIPSLLDFCKVRLHVSNKAPTTIIIGRRVKDSEDGDFNRDFLKIVNLTSAACTFMFENGAAECKISMEGLSTSQAVDYMRSLQGQVVKSYRQVLSAAWNLNQTILDDFNLKSRKYWKNRISIAKRAIDITCHGGFEKVTWDGASDTYPSQCIMYQLNEKEALELVHKAHEKGLVTYVSSGFTVKEIPLAIFSGVDGVGIGGAQVLRYMDKSTGMHGPCMEENISRILTERDMAAKSIRGRGVLLLCRLDTMYFEGTLSRSENEKRLALFKCLQDKHEHSIQFHLQDLKYILEKSDDGEKPILGTTKRLIQCKHPMLREASENDEIWDKFTQQLKSLVVREDEQDLVEEFYSDPWQEIRNSYHTNVCKTLVRQNSFMVQNKHFKKK